MSSKIKQFIEEGQTGENGPISQEHWDRGLRRKGMKGVARRISGLLLKKADQNRHGPCKKLIGIDLKALYHGKAK